MRNRLVASIGLLLGLSTALVAEAEASSRTMSLTFDDLPAQRAPVMEAGVVADHLASLIAVLEEHDAPAVGFVNESKLYRDGALEPVLVSALERWLEAGLELGNHTFSHPDLHRIPWPEFRRDLLAGEEITRPLAARYDRPFRFFRHPFLHSGRTIEVKEALAELLESHGYRIAPVTIDNSEWIFARAYDEALERGDADLQRRLAAEYVDYMEAKTAFYEDQSRKLLGREIPQVLLLHANALNAHHLAPLLDRLAARGYRFAPLDEVLEDPAYDQPDEYTGPAGISWIQRWAMAKKVDRSFFHGEPKTAQWVQQLAGIEE